ncbi:guanine nucleotide-binding protein g(o) subunit alpha [Anaeramoeba flamelloides]|uniref:Guanine nucleotide-binding protein alpha-16 subunit n=1 Tax=Anaeramoeba flamelloides TaxID=1746091 RepID=A0AAV7ZSB1_9EUKA|nr:guanine nucleotide-binding protein g(o) subunit alpha [Anaeramoeba flamelloides]|eukprot:Anaeramoba_flamelloidesa1054614_22.p1 GENE.a1054614_22~~a1054614_22.p1  ORF type:complete len:352 (-),score=72.44 a1054614_22:113-1168(-)
MGCLLGKEQNDFTDKNGMIDKMLRDDFTNTDNELKLLLLGPGESGKSTFLKQIKIIHKQGYEKEEERKKFSEVISCNILHSIQSLIEASINLKIDFDEENKDYITQLSKLNPITYVLNEDDLEMVQSVWKDQGIQSAYERRSEFQLIDCAKIFLDDAERILDPDFIPTVEDIIHSRSRTTGIFDVDFNYDNLKFRLWDVGGQRNERRKWIHCFQSVTAVLFVTSLNEYDQKLFEDVTVSRIKESLLLFDEICNSRWFSDTAIILFFNKDDLFREKIKKVNLNVCFEDYEGGCDYQNALEYIQDKYISCLDNESQQIYSYTTCATDTDNVRKVFLAVKDTILESQAKDMGYV